MNKSQSLPQSHVYIRNDSHQCEYEFENANYDVGHTYGINWKRNNWYHFHFNFNYHLVYFKLKTNSVGITEVSAVPMANNMYFIQWIITSYYQNGYELYRNNFVCIKILFLYHVQIQLMLQNTIMLWWISCKTNAITPIILFWSIDTIWWQRSGSTLAQVMACCLMAQAITWTNVDWSSVNSNDIHIS